MVSNQRAPLEGDFTDPGLCEVSIEGYIQNNKTICEQRYGYNCLQ